ncbi:hypothetical protein GCM10027064_08070 [Microbacterium petrolearium]|jgi:hypothetical protein
MAENTTDKAAAADWEPTEAGKKQATTLRIVSWVLWIVAIALELVAIFWLLRQRVPVGEEGIVRDDETGLLEAHEVGYEFPQWAFISLIVAFVVIGALSITGSMLWKRANRIDPARRSDTVRFFVQNQLGAIVAVVAFVPLIILVLMNKDMSKSQKGIAGAIGGVIAVVAIALGIDVDPPSVEQYTADRSTVIQILGEDEVVWVEGGGVYHVCAEVPDVENASTPQATGTTADAVAAGKTRLTLEFASELAACGLPVPENSAEIADAIRAIRDGATDTVLPAPVYADGVTPPFTPAS